jgi:hypothetical protein
LVETLPRYTTAIYNGCPKKGTFPKRWKKALILPAMKPGEEGSDKENKFRPINILNTDGKVLEEIIINRISHHVYSKEYINEN